MITLFFAVLLRPIAGDAYSRNRRVYGKLPNFHITIERMSNLHEYCSFNKSGESSFAYFSTLFTPLFSTLYSHDQNQRVSSHPV